MSQGPQDRVWMVERGAYEDGSPESEEDFRARVRAKLMDVEAVSDMVGGAFYIRPKRVEVSPDVWVTVSVRFFWLTEAKAAKAMGEFDRPQVARQEVQPHEFVGVGLIGGEGEESVLVPDGPPEDPEAA